MLVVVLAILVKLIILKLGLRGISKRITSLYIYIYRITSHIFKHLHSTERCFDSYSKHALTHKNSLCFKIIDKAKSKFHLKIKEALRINWRKPN